MIDYTTIFKTAPITNTEMTRNTSGVKCDLQGRPIEFYKDGWKDGTNKVNTPLLGAIASDDFIGIDIDNTSTYLEVLKLLEAIGCIPTYIANSLPFDLGKGGHLLFKYNSSIALELKTIRKYLKKYVKIDVQLDNALIYLATPANYTKQLVTPELTSLNDLIDFPPMLLTYLKGLVSNYVLEALDNATVNKVHTAIGDKARTEFYGFILEGDLAPNIVPKLTPKRDFAEIIDMNEIPEGSGTEWMLQVRKKLQVDPSVDEAMMLKTMVYLNTLWGRTAKHADKIHSDVARDIQSSDFVYNPDWRDSRFILSTSLVQHTIEVLYVHKENLYMVFNRTLQEMDFYTTFTALNDVIVALTGHVFTKDIVLKRAVKITLEDSPSKSSFLLDNKGKLHSFNMFVPSEALLIMRGETDLLNYREPRLILDFLRHLIPDTPTRDKFIGFLAYKYMTYSYSPIYFVLAGKGGAGKGVLVSRILSYLSGRPRVSSINISQLMNDFNSHLMSKDWIEIEEAGEGASKAEIARLVGKLKSLTGNENLGITLKGKEAINTKHTITPILSTNLETKLITDSVVNDRRMVLLKCPTALVDIFPYTYRGKTIDTTEEFLAELDNELPLFAKYLSDSYVTNRLPNMVYTSNTEWKNQDYLDYVENSLTYAEKLVNIAGTREANAFADILEDIGVEPKDIDKLFSLPNDNEPSYIMLYATAKNRILGVPSLEDIMRGCPDLVGANRNDFKEYKISLSKRFAGEFQRINAIGFSDKYNKRFNVDNAYTAPIQSTESVPVERQLVGDIQDMQPVSF